MLEASADLEDLLPADWAAQRLLHPAYAQQVMDTERVAWRNWAVKAGLNRFPTPAAISQLLFGIGEVNRYCVQHAGQLPREYSSRTKRFFTEDYDFDPPLWNHWRHLQATDPQVWTRVAKGIATSWSAAWERFLEARVQQKRGAVTSPIGHTRLTASWIQRLQALPCLLDTFSRPSRPAGLYRYNADTAPLINIERFVREDLRPARSV